MSPGGKRFAYMAHQNGGDYFIVAETGKGIVVAADASRVKARSVSFVSENYAIVVASATAKDFRFVGKWEHSDAFSFNIEEKKFRTLLEGVDNIYPAQSGLGRIVGRLAGADAVFMPAYMGYAGDGEPSYDLLKADLDSNRATIAARGEADTIDWFVDDDGTVLAREDLLEKEDIYRIFTRRSGDWDLVYEEKQTSGAPFSLIGVMPDRSGLVILRDLKIRQYSSLSKLSFDGRISLPIFQRPDASIEAVVLDGNRRLLSVEYAGLFPTYEFFDPELTRAMNVLAVRFPEDSVRLVGWTENFETLLVLVEGGATAPSYHLFDRRKREIARIASRYRDIDDAEIGPVATIEYKARDGRKIPSLLTRPPRTELGRMLPLIVMPHGGPASYDAVGFDFMAQYFASRGYLVLQPNFRGSDGFGAAHRLAGNGQWGGKMQDDLTDGVKALIAMKWADPSRVCIIGGSYGGYAALAGGAYTPDLYKCVAAIAPVSDLAHFLKTERRESGADSAVYEYWTELIGDPESERLASISPVNAASSFKAPVLLVHGLDDTVVPFTHSARMEAALKRAGKEVTLVRLKKEDHWLSRSETRLQTLKELDAFVARTIGGPP